MSKTEFLAADSRVIESIQSDASLESALKNALDCIQCGVIITAATRRVVFTNARARRILDRRNALLLVDGVLVANTSDETRSLHQSIVGSLESSDQRTVTLSVRGANLDPVLNLHVLRLRRAAGGAEAILFVCDPTLPLTVSQTSLRNLFGLTRAEAVMADLMFQGLSVESAADRLCVSIHTARTHLKRILLKTDTTRQGELLRLIFLSTGLVAFDDQLKAC